MAVAPATHTVGEQGPLLKLQPPRTRVLLLVSLAPLKQSQARQNPPLHDVLSENTQDVKTKNMGHVKQARIHSSSFLVQKLGPISHPIPEGWVHCPPWVPKSWFSFPAPCQFPSFLVPILSLSGGCHFYTADPHGFLCLCPIWPGLFPI